MISDEDVHCLAEYVDRWHNHWRLETMRTVEEVCTESYCSTAANDILEAVLMEKARLPLSSADETLIQQCTVQDVIESYANMVMTYFRQSTCDQAKRVFEVQYWEAMCMLLDFTLRKDTHERY